MSGQEREMLPRDDRPEEACGVFGIYSREHEVARTTFFGLYALQHRGQESAGIATADGQRIVCHAAWAWSPRSSTSDDLRDADRATSRSATPATRRPARRGSATPSRCWSTARPGQIALAHNGNLVNAPELRAELEPARLDPFDTTTDTEVIARADRQRRGRRPGPTGRRASCRGCVGAYCLAIADQRRV